MDETRPIKVVFLVNKLCHAFKIHCHNFQGSTSSSESFQDYSLIQDSIESQPKILILSDYNRFFD